MIEQYLNPIKVKAGENDIKFLLSLADEPLVRELMNNGSLDYLDDLRDIQTGNFNRQDLASIIAQIYLACVIAYNLKEVIDATNPITNYTSCFGILEEVDQNPDLEYWLAEQSALWVINEQERNKRPYWPDLMTYVYKGVLSNDPFEIDRYDGLLLELMGDDTPADPNFDYRAMLADSEISEDDINLFSSLGFYNKSIMQSVINEAIECDISMTCDVLISLHDILVVAKSKS